MPNRSYVKGRRREYQAIALLEATGALACRTAGSHSLFDVIAVTAAQVRLIQLKGGGEYLSEVDRERLELLQVPANVTKEVWRWPDRSAPIITVIP
jgi:Holliday junction resolvase